MSIEYNFKYMPLVGKLSGESMVQQTETAINEIAKIVNDNSAQAEIINTLAETANANSVEALEKATEALDTSSRVYIKETLAVNLNNYCESQLIYINNVASQNLPIAHKGFLEVKTNDDKTQATQVFADDVDRKFYVRTGAITATTVGDVTTYTASYGTWVDIPNITDLDNYLALVGGTMSGDIQFSASDWKIKGSDLDNDAELSIVGATDNLNGSSLNLYGRNHTESGAFELNANNGTYTKTLKGTATGNLTWDGNISATTFIGNLTGIASGNLPLSGGTITGNITVNSDHAKTVYTDTNIGSSSVGLVGDVDDYGIAILSKDNVVNESCLTVSSSEQSTDPRFQLRAGNGTTTKDLVGKPNGTLTWDGDDIALSNNVLALSGGTMTGAISFDATGEIGYRATTHTEPANPCKQLIVSSTDIDHWDDEGGAKITLHTYDSTQTNTDEDGSFSLLATDGTNSKTLIGKPNGNLTWNGKNLDYAPDYRVFNSYETFTAPTVFSNRIKVVPSGKFGGYKQVGKLVYVHYTFQMNVNLNKGAWTIAQGFPQAFNSGGAWTLVPLTVTAWYGDNESGYFTSAALDGYGALYLLLGGNVTAGTSGDTNHGIVVHGVYLAK